MPGPSESFGDIAVERDFVTGPQVSECLKIQKAMKEMGVVPKKLGEILAEKGYLDREQLTAVLAAQGKSIRQIGPYVIERKLGKGAAATVYRARHAQTKKAVALKVLSAASAKNRKYVERFQREGRMAIRMRHRNLVQGFEVGVWEGFHFFAMELVAGEPVSALLRSGNAVPEAQAVRIGAQVAEALAYIHAHGNVHRDVKPQNVLLAADGTAKLADFGLVKMAEELGLTRAGATLGTPYYISPEQATGAEGADPRSDVYSLGATLYHMVTGAVPFGGDSSAGVIRQHLGEDLVSPARQNPNLSADICAVIVRAMQKDPEARYPNAAAMLADLRCVAEGRPLPVAGGARSRPARVRAALRIAAAVATGAVIGGLLVLKAARPDKPAGKPGDGQAGKKIVVPEKADPEKEYYAVVGFVEENPSGPMQAIGRLRAYVRAHPGSKWTVKAQRKIRLLELARECAAEEKVLARRLAGGELMEGLAHWRKVRDRFQGTAFQARLDAAGAKIEAAVGDRFAGARARADELKAAEQYAEARAAVEPFASCGVARVEADAKSLLDSLSREEGEDRVAVKQTVDLGARLAFRELQGRVAKLARGRAYTAAEGACDEALKNVALASRQGEVEALRERVRSAAKVWRGVNQAVKRMAGGEHTVTLKTGITGRTRVAAEGGGVFVTFGAGRFPLPDSLKPTFMVRLYLDAAGAKGAAAQLNGGEFLLFEGDAEGARAAFQKAELLGEDVRERMVRVGMAVRESDARRCYLRVERARSAGKWALVRDLLAKLTGDFGGTRLVLGRQKELKALLARCRTELGEPGAEAPALRAALGKTVPLFNGLDLEEWEERGGKWRVEEGRLVGSGWAVVTGVPEWQDYQLTAQFRVREGSPSVKFLIREGKEGCYYLQLGRDPGFHMTWEEGKKRKRLVIVERQIRRGEWHLVRIKARGDRLTAFLDGAVAAEARDASYGTGKVGLATWGGEVQFKDVLLRLETQKDVTKVSESSE